MSRATAIMLAMCMIAVMAGCGGGGGGSTSSAPTGSLTITADFGAKSRAVPEGTTRVHVEIIDPATSQRLNVTYQGAPHDGAFDLTPGNPSVTVDGVRTGDVRIQSDAYDGSDHKLSSCTTPASVASGATNQVSLESHSFSVSVAPESATLFAGERRNITVTVSTTDDVQFTTSYHWTCDGAAGSLAGGNDQTTDAAVREYQASSNGTDTVTITPTITYGGVHKTLKAITVPLTVTSTGTFTLCGEDGKGFGVDDDITVKVGDTTIYHDLDTTFAGKRGPFTFDSHIGETVSLSLLDSYGSYIGIDDIYIKYADGRKKLLFAHWQRHTESSGGVWTGSATIPVPDPL